MSETFFLPFFLSLFSCLSFISFFLSFPERDSRYHIEIIPTSEYLLWVTILTFGPSPILRHPGRSIQLTDVNLPGPRQCSSFQVLGVEWRCVCGIKITGVVCSGQ